MCRSLYKLHGTCIISSNLHKAVFSHRWETEVWKGKAIITDNEWYLNPVLSNLKSGFSELYHLIFHRFCNVWKFIWRIFPFELCFGVMFAIHVSEKCSRRTNAFITSRPMKAAPKKRGGGEEPCWNYWWMNSRHHPSFCTCICKGRLINTWVFIYFW